MDLAFDLIATPVKDAFKGEEIYRKIDVEMASAFADLSKAAGAKFLVSVGMVPTKGSGTDYASRAKKDFENYARKLGFQRLAIMKPMWVNREDAGKWYEKLYNDVQQKCNKGFRYGALPCLGFHESNIVRERIHSKRYERGNGFIKKNADVILYQYYIYNCL